MSAIDSVGSSCYTYRSVQMMVIIMLLDIDIGSMMVFHCDVRIGQYSMEKVYVCVNSKSA